ncbi:hypothetical protein EB796_001555 [Bugula neritina]|uniref:Uncharacterized protein n=1 Tax=Bugula neritina TaxID=10212 RepID=A0A7J7KPM4_BUGNE|nr:hypothetical protein EB796_001555 [Bugula neritina]
MIIASQSFVPVNYCKVRQPRALVGELEKGRIGIACFHSYNNIRLLSSVGDFPNAITNFSASILLNC